MRIIRGKYGRRRFNVPRNITARPTTDFARENLFNVLENMIDMEGIKALDLFAGTGAISLEMLSRGAARVTAVEKAQVQIAFLKSVKTTLDAQNLAIIKGDVFKYLSTDTGSYDLIFADPPYDMERFDEVAQIVLSSDLLTPGGIFILEHGKGRDYTALPGFHRHLTYGSVNFSLFRKK